jgi:dihydroneopterin aldolase
MKTQYEITLRGMRFFACVGVLPHERTLPQPIEIDVTVWPRAPKGKKVAGLLLDYRKIYEVTASVMEEGPGPLDHAEVAVQVTRDD